MSNSSQSDGEDFNGRLNQLREQNVNNYAALRILWTQSSPSISPDNSNDRRLDQPMDQNPVYSPDAQPFELLIEGYNNSLRNRALNRTGDSGYLTCPESPIILMDNWERHFPSPIHEPSVPQNTPPQNTPPQYNEISSPDLFPELESSSSIDSPNMLIPRAPIRLHTTQPSVEMDWSDDGNNEQLYRLMDKYEGWGSDYDEMNELILKKT
ncbi:unnamed protein product [Macrosiphum euphorbiae]|uniref:Uncharacterized protein n=1 Tax=Macrosiphum euphorbiae TaxID=13131 RepID=A0AAV0YD75_9HEMI|nr:unnamed protein product [Macrosiphum euphorbiae]CAI6377547.1 unnamed protein product [Macrosiphum euphorbiae]